MINRRGVLAAGALAAAPAAAEESGPPEVRWRCISAYPRSLETIYGTLERFARDLAEATGGRFRIETFAAGEIVPGLQALDATANGTVEMCQAASYYFVGKDPTFGFGTAMPFGFNSRLQDAWLYAGGGQALLDEFYQGFNVIGLPGGNTGCQMGGWFRKEIKGTDDLKGLKMRIGGLGGRVLQRLGVVPQQIAGGDVYAALERGTIDAVEWSGPADDERLGFNKVARYYYYPGFWEVSATIHLFINRDRWQALPPVWQAAVRMAAARANSFMQARYDALNPPALRRLVASGVQLRPFPPEVMQAAFTAAAETYAEIAETNQAFRKIHDHWQAFRSDGYLWWRVAELETDVFMARARHAPTKG